MFLRTLAALAIAVFCRVTYGESFRSENLDLQQARQDLFVQWAHLKEKHDYLDQLRAPRRLLQAIDMSSVASQMADMLANSIKMNLDLFYLFIAAPIEQVRVFCQTTKNIIREFEPLMSPALFQLLTSQDYLEIVIRLQQSMKEVDVVITSLIDRTRDLFSQTSTRPIVVQRVERVSIAEDGTEQHVTKTIVGREGDPALDDVDTSDDAGFGGMEEESSEAATSA